MIDFLDEAYALCCVMFWECIERVHFFLGLLLCIYLFFFLFLLLNVKMLRLDRFKDIFSTNCIFQAHSWHIEQWIWSHSRSALLRSATFFLLRQRSES